MKLGLLLLLLAYTCECKVYTRCQLAKALDKTKLFSRTFLPSYLCVIEKSVSNRDTSVVNVLNNKKYYGLYQIPQEYCKEMGTGGFCSLACSSLLADDVTVATRCAASIVIQNGFNFWSKYEQCKDNLQFYSKEIYKCPEMQKKGRSSPVDSKEEIYQEMVERELYHFLMNEDKVSGHPNGSISQI